MTKFLKNIRLKLNMGEPVSNERDRQAWLVIGFWLLALVLGASQAWFSRHAMNPDGVSYLDMGDAYLRGDWAMAINAYWSPLYACLLGVAMLALKPSPFWEFSVVHLVNFIIYVWALACFHFFWSHLMRYHGERKNGLSHDRVTLPGWALVALGYTLFIWSSLSLITISVVTPDMCVAALVYLASGIILRICTGSVSWPMFGLLGVVLGFAYLAKSPMFPLALVFLGVSLFAAGDSRKARSRGLVALLFFLLIGGPFVAGLSKAKGRITFGDAGVLNYAFLVGGANEGKWNSGTKIFDSPAVYEFAMQNRATYPVWYDPSNWNEGLTGWHEGLAAHFDPLRQIAVLWSSMKTYVRLLIRPIQGMVVCFLILYLMERRPWLGAKEIGRYWVLLIPAICALGMYALVAIELRYVGAFVVLAWAGVFCGLTLRDSQESRRLMATATIISVLVMFNQTFRGNNFLRPMGESSTHVHGQVAAGLKQMGVQPGDKVATIGLSHTAYWARLAGVQINVEITSDDADGFWTADNGMKLQALNSMANAGAGVVLARMVQDNGSMVGWEKIESTDHYIYFLKKPTVGTPAGAYLARE